MCTTIKLQKVSCIPNMHELKRLWRDMNVLLVYRYCLDVNRFLSTFAIDFNNLTCDHCVFCSAQSFFTRIRSNSLWFSSELILGD